jgi:hypothetical protein
VVWTELIWLRIRCSGGLFGHGNETSGSIKCLGNFWVDERLAASQEGFGSMELVWVKLADSNLKSCEEWSKSEQLNARQHHEWATTTWAKTFSTYSIVAVHAPCHCLHQGYWSKCQFHCWNDALHCFGSVQLIITQAVVSTFWTDAIQSRYVCFHPFILQPANIKISVSVFMLTRSWVQTL